MNTVKFSKSNTKIIAHRGLSALEKENTAAALLPAAETVHPTHLTQTLPAAPPQDKTEGTFTVKPQI